MASIFVTGSSKYVEFQPGIVLINGEILYIRDSFRINDDELVGSPGANFGDYYIYVRPSRKVMESYYGQNWEYLIKSVAAAGAAPTTLMDEFCLGRIEKRDVGGVTQLTAVELNRTKKLIDTKDISDEAITPEKLHSSITFDGEANNIAVHYDDADLREDDKELNIWICEDEPADADATDLWIPPSGNPDAIRTIRGTVANAGSASVAEGTGYSVARVGAGIVDVTFSTAFSDSPSTVATVSANGDYSCTAHLTTVSSVRITTRLAGAAADAAFHFIATGPS